MPVKTGDSLLNLAKQLRDTDGMLSKIVDASVEVMKAKLEHEFATGTGPDGEAWAAPKAGRNDPLVKDGDLRQSFIDGVYKGGKGGFYNAPENWYFGVKSDIPYAAIQHYGGTLPNGGVIPPHQIVPYEWPGGWGPALKEACAEALKEWFSERGYRKGRGFTR